MVGKRENLVEMTAFSRTFSKRMKVYSIIIKNIRNSLSSV